MDLRIERIFRDEMKDDKSFQEKPNFLSLLFGSNKYSQVEMRETWELGIKHGIELGLRKAGLEGQRIELNHNTIDPRHKEFLSKFYQLAAEYNCAIQHHPEIGMVVITQIKIR